MEWVFVALLIALLTWRIAPARGVKNISTKELKNILNDKDEELDEDNEPKKQHKNKKTKVIKRLLNLSIHITDI